MTPDGKRYSSRWPEWMRSRCSTRPATRSSHRSGGGISALRAFHPRRSLGRSRSSQGPGELAILDTATNTVAAAVAVGKTPHWKLVQLRRPNRLRDHEAANDVSVVDLAGRRVLATIRWATHPERSRWQPGATAAAASPRRRRPPGKKSKTVTMNGVTYAERDEGRAEAVQARAGSRRPTTFWAHLPAGRPRSEADADDRERGEQRCTTSRFPPSASTRTFRQRARCGWTSSSPRPGW